VLALALAAGFVPSASAAQAAAPPGPPATAAPPAATTSSAEAAPPPRDGEMGEEIEVSAPTRFGRIRAREDALNVQVLSAAELEATGAQSFQEALRRIPGLNLNDEQGNRFQQDVSVRGFTASPVTGLPQTISVFVDGVRVNEPAAEEVNFDLLPLEDAERIEVIHGPMAVFGRNTIGAAINVVTRRGAARPDAEVEVEGGSFGQQAARARVSGPVGPLDGYVSVGELTERGWRDDSPSQGLRAYGKLGYRKDATDVWVSYQFQRDRLGEAGSLPQSMLVEDPRQNYTSGDYFQPTLSLATVNARQALGRDLSLTLNAFVRSLGAEQFNSSLLAPDTFLTNDTLGLGAALQVDHRATFGAVTNELAAGAEVGRNAVHVEVTERPNAGFSTSDSGAPLPQLVGDLSDAQRLAGAFAQDQLRVTRGPLAGVGLRAAIRFDWISHDVTDDSPPNPGNATGSISYTAWTPAAGLTWAFLPGWLASASFARGFRAPAFLELTCSDPTAPCIGLQAGVAPDATFTNLRPVTSRTWEAGVSGTIAEVLTAWAEAFLTDLQNDIYSVSVQGSTALYFRNVGATRRQGLEAGLRFQRGGVALYGTYAYTLATFQEDLVLGTPRTPDGTEQVQRGDQVPLVPNHLLNLDARVRVLDWLTLSAGAAFVGSQYFRGDEANVAPKLPSYWVLRAGVEARWRSWSASVRVANLLDATYQTFGTFAPDGRVAGQPIVPFLTPGAPLRVVAGIRWELD
jgi:outer membrane receptor protein involved in Fe transport